MSVHILKHLVIETFYADYAPNTGDNVLSALNRTIETIQMVEGLILVQIAQGSSIDGCQHPYHR